MIITVNWQFILLNANDPMGYRVKRRTTGPPPLAGAGTDMPMADNWVSAPAPPQIHYIPDNRDYVFVFWSLNAADPISHQSAAQIQTGNIANDSHMGGQWTINAKAYYVWNFGAGPGDNVLEIDAFDIQAGDFIPDDFVDASPDPGGALTVKANNGIIDTTTDIPGPPAPLPAGSPAPPSLKVSARDTLPAKKFGYWLYWPNISPLFLSYYSNPPATVGTPNPHDIVVHHNDIVVAIAFYNEVQQSLSVPLREYLYNPWWWLETRGGLVPPPPPPWPEGLAGALALLDVANRTSARLQPRVLEIALEELSIASNALRRQIDGLPKT